MMFRFIMVILVGAMLVSFLLGWAQDPKVVANIGTTASKELNNVIVFVAGAIFAVELLRLRQEN